MGVEEFGFGVAGWCVAVGEVGAGEAAVGVGAVDAARAVVDIVGVAGAGAERRVVARVEVGAVELEADVAIFGVLVAANAAALCGRATGSAVGGLGRGWVVGDGWGVRDGLGGGGARRWWVRGCWLMWVGGWGFRRRGRSLLR